MAAPSIARGLPLKSQLHGGMTVRNENQGKMTGYDLIIKRMFNDTPQRIFRAWTAPEELMKWWGPRGFTSPICLLDLRVGGEYQFCSRSPQGVDFWSRGVFCEIAPGRKLVLSDSFSDAEGNVIAASSVGLPGGWPSTLTVILTFEERLGKTIFTLEHKGLPFAMITSCRAGWNEALDKLQMVINNKQRSMN